MEQQTIIDALKADHWAEPQTHITLTGIMAGMPACGIGRADMLAAGGRGMHIPYVKCAGELLDFVNQNISCPECREVVYDAMGRKPDER